MAKTYNDIYLDIRRKLIKNGISSPSLEARELVSAVAGKTKEEFFRDARMYVNAEFERKVEALLERRLGGEPLAYIIGEWEFMGLSFDINENVLIPRVDTEVLAEAVIKEIGTKKYRVLDLCTGSGCLGISIGMSCPESSIVLADISPKALQIARKNVRRNRITARAVCVAADAMKAASVALGSFDVIVSNPPYIRTEELAKLDDSVKFYEPVLALDGGEDGLDFYRAIIPGYKHALKNGGLIMFECGVGQSKDIENIFACNGYSDIKMYRDTLNTERVVSAVLKV